MKYRKQEHTDIRAIINLIYYIQILHVAYMCEFIKKLERKEGRRKETTKKTMCHSSHEGMKLLL